jgi:hypothetical protein
MGALLKYKRVQASTESYKLKDEDSKKDRKIFLSRFCECSLLDLFIMTFCQKNTKIHFQE